MWLVLHFLSINVIFITASEEVWEKDLSSQMKIGISPDKYQVNLKCHAESFVVNVTVDADFEGVIYTRGDFRNKRKPCFQFRKHFIEQTENYLKYSLRIPFTKCHTIMDASAEQYETTIVIQNDEELIMPGDGAFQLACAFSPEIRLGATILAKSKSRISLVDADPSANKIVENAYEVLSDTDIVSYPSSKVRDEL